MAPVSRQGGRTWPPVRLAAAVGCILWLLILLDWAATQRDFEGLLALFASALLLLLLPPFAALGEERWPFAVLGLVGLPLTGVAVPLILGDLHRSLAPSAELPTSALDTIAVGWSSSPAHLLFQCVLLVGGWATMCLAASASPTCSR